MVKLYLVSHTFAVGGLWRQYNVDTAVVGMALVKVNAVLVADLLVTNFLYQGMLDLHGMLYSPNGGEYLGHLPADNFLDFVQDVTTNMVTRSGANMGDELPYSLEL